MRAQKIPEGRVKQHDMIAGAALTSVTTPSLTELLQHINEKLDVLVELTSKKHEGNTEKKAIRLRDVIALTGISRSQIYAMMNPSSDAYDPSWPLPLRTNKMTRWLYHEVIEWLEMKASARVIH